MCAGAENVPCNECAKKRNQQLKIFGGVVLALISIAAFLYFKMNKKLPPVSEMISE